MSTAPTSVEAWIERRVPRYRFGAVLVLLMTTYVVMAASPSDVTARVLTVVLEGLTLLAALVASRVGRTLFRVAVVVVVGAVLAAVASVAWGSSALTTGWFFAVNVLLVAAAPIAIARCLYHRPVVDLRTVLGALCIYMLLGIMFAFLYAAIDAIDDASFFTQTDSPGIQVFLYFSFVTQTTVGFGDFTAATNLGRTLATTEALLGQLYLVTVIAVLVSRMTVVHRDRDAPAVDPADVDDAGPPAVSDGSP
ncbi:MAG: potassium channel family protein [Aeromicrobium sp.]